MVSYRISYLRFVLSFILMFLSFIFHAQEKSKEIRTINNRKFYIHKVEKGQSLYAISKIYATDVNVILADNDEAINGIKPGQELKISIDSKAVTPVKIVTTSVNAVADTNKYIYHRVVKRETIYSICKQYGITDKQLELYNPEISSGIKPEQMLVVGERNKREVALVNSVNFNSPVAAVISDTNISKPRSKKDAYKIGLILPFKLSESELLDPSVLVQSKANFPKLQTLAIDFLMGFNKALDSLKTDDCKIETYVYDIDDKDSLKLETLCKSEEFKMLDLIFGPVYPSGFKIVSAYSKNYSIPLVSPFTQQNKILFRNNLSSKTNPSQFTLMESLADFCIDSCRGNSVIYIVNNGMLKEQQYVKAFKNYYNERIKAMGFSLKDSVAEVKGLSGAKEKYISGKRNVYVLLSNNQVYLADFITQLAVWSEKKEITLAGWQNITQMDNIDQDYLNRLSFTFPGQTNLTNVKAYSNLIKVYQSEMSSDPDDAYFIGFDIAQFYIGNLKTHGPEFMSKLNEFPGEGNFMRFKFYHPDESTGFENKGVYIFKYKDFQLFRSQWK